MIHVPLPAQSTRLAKKKTAAAYSFFYYFSVLYLDPSTGAEVVRYERFFFLLLLSYF